MYICKLSKAGDLARMMKPCSYVLRFTYVNRLVWYFLVEK